MTSFASANGPSVTSSRPPASWTRAPAALGTSPAVSSSAPALVASSPSFMIASISSGGGADGCWAAVSRTRYRMTCLPSVRGAVQVNGQCGEPGPADQDAPDEAQVRGRAAAAGGDPDEAGEEQHPGDPGVRGPARAPLGREPPRHHEARRDQAAEPDGARGEVQDAVPADGTGAGRGTGREAQGRIGAEDPGADETGAVAGDQPGRPPPGRQGAAQSGRRGGHHEPGDHEVGDLDPAERPVAPQAPLVPREVEPVPGQGLAEPHHDVERTGEDAAPHEATGDPRGGSAVGRGAGGRLAHYRFSFGCVEPLSTPRTKERRYDTARQDFFDDLFGRLGRLTPVKRRSYGRPVIVKLPYYSVPRKLVPCSG